MANCKKKAKKLFTKKSKRERLFAVVNYPAQFSKKSD